MTRGTAVQGLFTAIAIAVGATSASAQVFGTFIWQMQPYCNQVTLTLTSVPGNFTLDGSDNMCGAAKKASVSGIGVFNPDGTVGLNFTIVLPTSQTVGVAANVSPANGQGTWTDTAGNSGTFAFFGATPGLPDRPDGQVYFRATTQQSAPAPSQAVLWTTVSHNTGGGTYNASTGVYTIPSTGLYSIAFSVAWSVGAATSGRVCSYLVRPGASSDVPVCTPIVGGSFIVGDASSTVIPLTAGQTIYVGTNETSSDPLTLYTGSGPSFTVTKLR